MPDQVRQIEAGRGQQHQQKHAARRPLPPAQRPVQEKAQPQQQRQRAGVEIGAAVIKFPVGDKPQQQLGQNPAPGEQQLLPADGHVDQRVPQHEKHDTKSGGNKGGTPAEPEKGQQQPGHGRGEEKAAEQQHRQHQARLPQAAREPAQDPRGRGVSQPGKGFVGRHRHAAAQRLKAGQQHPGGKPAGQQGGQSKLQQPPPGDAPKGLRVADQAPAQIQNREDAEHVARVKAADDGKAQAQRVEQGLSLPPETLDPQRHQRQQEHRVQPHDAPGVGRVVAAESVGRGEEQAGWTQASGMLQIDAHGEPAAAQLQQDDPVHPQGQLILGEEQKQQVEGACQIVGV